MQIEGSLEDRPKSLDRKPAPPVVWVEDKTDLRKSIKACFADELAPILNSKILSGCRWDAHHPLKPLSRLLKAIVRKARPICHCDRVTEDRVKRRKVVLSSATEAKPFGSYFGHGRTDFGGNSVSFPL